MTASTCALQIGNTAVRPLVYAAEDGTVSATQLWDGTPPTSAAPAKLRQLCDIRHADYKQQSLVTRYAHPFGSSSAKGARRSRRAN